MSSLIPATLKTNWEKLRTWFISRKLREQAIIATLTYVVIYLVWESTFFNPVLMERQHLQANITNLNQQIVTLQNQITEIINTATQKQALVGEEEQEKQSLFKRAELLNENLSLFTSELVTPDQMAEVLTNILRDESGLTLINLKSLPAEILAETSGDDAKNGQTLFKRGVIIRLEGDYNSTYNYLKRLEDLNWRIFWDEIDYDVIDHPRAEIIIKFHVLSRELGWIGA